VPQGDLSTRIRALAPGIALCALIAAASMLMQRVEERAIGHAIIEGLVIAILVGMTLRTLWAPSRRNSCSSSRSCCLALR